MQMGVLLPLPWSLVADELLWGLNCGDCGYADISILINIKLPLTVSDVLQTTLGIVQQ
jgi:hypothetical protein